MRGVSFVLLLAVGCRTSEIARDRVSAVAPVSASVSVAESPPPPPPAPPQASDLTNDDVAALVLRDFDRATHHVRTTAVDAGFGVSDAIDVVASNGDVVHTFVDPSLGAGGVHVERLRGDDWAKSDLVAWVVVGMQPGMCGFGQGFLALVEGRTVRALAPWSGSCGTPYHASFLTAAGRGALLEEEDENGGEDGVGEVSDRVWLVSGARWKLAGNVRREQTENWVHATPGWDSKMDSTVAGDASGIVVNERWYFTSESTQKTTDRTRTLRYTLRADSLVVPRNPAPTP